jgi:hypothetical protein
MKPITSLAVLATLSLSTAQTTGKLGDAIVVTNNPPGASYTVTFAGTVKGSLNATSSANGTGIDFKLQIEGLPADKGPYSKTSWTTFLFPTSQPSISRYKI